MPTQGTTLLLVASPADGHCEQFARAAMPSWRIERAATLAEAKALLSGCTPELVLVDLAVEDCRTPVELDAFQDLMPAMEVAVWLVDPAGALQWHHGSHGPRLLLDRHAAPDHNARLLAATGQRVQTSTRWRVLATAVNHTANAVVVADARCDDLPLIYVNAAFTANTGYSRDESLGRNCRFLQGTDTDPQALEALRATLLRGEGFDGELLNYRKDGTAFWNRLRIRPVHGADGVVTHFIAILEDVTRTKQTRERLRASEARLELAMSASELAMWDWNIARDEVYYNDQWQSLLETPAEELLRRNMLAEKLVLPADQEFLAELERHLASSQQPHVEGEYAVTTRSGTTKWVVARIKAVQRDAEDHAMRVIGVLRDVTSRRQGLRVIEEARQRWQRAVEGTSDGLFDWDLASGHVWYAPRFSELLGYTPQEFPETFTAFQRAIHEEDRALVLEKIRRHLEQRAALDVRSRFAMRDGTYRWMRLRGQSQRDEAGRPRRLSGSIRDISAQIEAEEALHRSQDFYGTILDTLPLCVSYVDSDERVVYANRAFEKLLRMQLADARGRTVREVFGEQRYAKFGPRLRAAIAGDVVEAQTKYLDNDGNELDFETTYLPDRAGTSDVIGCFVVARDVTERRRLEAELRQSQKMEAVGRLTGGMAHDFNNLLSVVIGNTQLLARSLKETPRLLKQAETALSAAKRGAGLIRRLLAFARQQALEPKVVNVHELMREVDELLRRTLPQDIELVFDLPPETWAVKTDRGQFENAVVNLVINARDAIAGSGRITVSTANVVLDEQYARRHAEARAGEFLRVTVADTGSGMTPDVLKRVFEPFFTTKETGKGSGLGLPMVYGFVKQSGGHIALDSAPGSGTLVHMYFPRTFEPADSREEGAVTRDVLPRGSELILVVEDDAEVRATAVEILRSQGYGVLQAANGSEAQEIAARDPGIALVFSDVMLPGGVVGTSIVNKLRAGRPGLKALLTSGFTESTVLNRGLLDGSVEVLDKPYEVAHLLQRIREILDKD